MIARKHLAFPLGMFLGSLFLGASAFGGSPITSLTSGTHVIDYEIPGHLSVNGADVTIVSGAQIDSLQLDFGSLTMLGGNVFGDVVSDSPTLFIRGGTIGGNIFSADFDNNIEISGGNLLGSIQAGDSATITVVGTGFNYPEGPLADLSGTLAGTLANGDSLSVAFSRGSTANIVLVVPEPAAITITLLLSLMAIVVYRTRSGALHTV